MYVQNNQILYEFEIKSINIFYHQLVNYEL